MARTYQDEKTASGEEARQGRTGTGLIYVLVIGLILAFVVWGGVEVYGSWLAQKTPNHGDNPAPAVQTQSRQPAG